MKYLNKVALLLSTACIAAVPFVHSEEHVLVADLVTVDSTPVNRSLNGGVVSYAESVREVRPAIVSVYSKSFGKLSREELLHEYFFGSQPRQQPRVAEGLGSGVIVSKNGYIITNNHVVSGADELTVRLDDNKVYQAEVIGTDPGTDIAVIKIEAENLPVATLTDSEQIEVGDVVFAIGNPLGVGKTVTMGIVSATGRYQLSRRAGAFEDFIQTDAPINAGNSGGALVDALGRVIGINSMIQTDGRSSGSIGIGFAVPMNLAYSVMRDLVESGSVSRGFLGVGIEALDEDKASFFGVDSLRGALVNEVNPASPAEAAGIKSGDIIVGVNGEDIDSPNDLKLTISQIKPGSNVELALIRDGVKETATAVLIQRVAEGTAFSPVSKNGDASLEGVTLEALTEELREMYELEDSVEGVVVTAVESESPYGDQLPEGMVILKVNGQKVGDPKEVEEFLNPGSKNMLLVAFRGVYRWVSIQVD